MKQDSMMQMLAHPGTRVVVVERHDLAAQECSLRYSQATGIWHGGDHAVQDEWKRRHCSAHASPAFTRHEHEFFTWIRSTLRRLSKTYLDLSFEEFVNDSHRAEARLHSFAGLPPQTYRGACIDGCNCGY